MHRLAPVLAAREVALVLGDDERNAVHQQHRVLAALLHALHPVLVGGGEVVQVLPGRIELDEAEFAAHFMWARNSELHLCRHCGANFNVDTCDIFVNLFEMNTMITNRVERISCNEEERIKQGYDISTHYIFSSSDGREMKNEAAVRTAEGEGILEMVYGPSADLWRINRGWRRSLQHGYSLNMSKGLWVENLESCSK